ncbi:MAG: DUF5132 domain-containing protein [Candidatus Brocadiaceae bacterium]|nr:DUF5132 domain-containing protein [Candidatus Brocadiaceae bacterium]
MALFNNGLKGNLLTGLVVGIGVTVLAPVVIPVIAGVAKPVTKALIKGGILLFEGASKGFAEAGEVFQDVVAEAKAEVAEMREKKASQPHEETEV